MCRENSKKKKKLKIVFNVLSYTEIRRNIHITRKSYHWKLNETARTRILKQSTKNRNERRRAKNKQPRVHYISAAIRREKNIQHFQIRVAECLVLISKIHLNEMFFPFWQDSMNGKSVIYSNFYCENSLIHRILSNVSCNPNLICI